MKPRENICESCVWVLTRLISVTQRLLALSLHAGIMLFKVMAPDFCSLLDCKEIFHFKIQLHAVKMIVGGCNDCFNLRYLSNALKLSTLLFIREKRRVVGMGKWEMDEVICFDKPPPQKSHCDCTDRLPVKSIAAVNTSVVPSIFHIAIYQEDWSWYERQRGIQSCCATVNTESDCVSQGKEWVWGCAHKPPSSMMSSLCHELLLYCIKFCRPIWMECHLSCTAQMHKTSQVEARFNDLGLG